MIFDFSVKLKPFQFMKSVFSEPDGTGSCSRILIASIVSFTIGVGVALVWKIHTPVTVNDFNSFLGAAGMFITTTCAPLYLINKGSSAAVAMKQGNGNGNGQ